VQDAAGTRVARSPAAVVGEVVVLPVTGQGVDQLVAVDATDGHEVWRAPMLDHPSAADGVAVGYLSREPPSNSNVIALSTRDGSRLWSQPGMPSYGDLWAVGDGVVAVRDPTDGGIVAYDLMSGALRWKRPGDQQLPGEPQLVAGGLVVLLWEGNVGTLSTTTGATVWQQTKPLDSTTMSSAAASASALYVSMNSVPWTD
jgi:outer membrane protein assembly factor BamB